ncbi:MAG: hypothetical protein EOO47_26940, partial [Flavobacterium sp.]
MKNILKKIKDLFWLKLQIDELLGSIQYNSRVNILNELVVNSQNFGVTKEKYCEQDFVVSLTTYDKRLYDVYLTIESLMQQTRKANRIVLWLDQQTVNNPLPMSLQMQIVRGLEVRYCKDLRSYTKLIPSLKAFPADTIITVDDDLIYDVDMLDKLIMAYLKDPTKIYYNRGHLMKLVSSNELEKYQCWQWQSPILTPSHFNFPTGVGGVLYPPNCFDKEVLNESVFMEICKYADDVWFKAMAMLKGTLSQKVYTRNALGEEYLENPNVQDIAL